MVVAGGVWYGWMARAAAVAAVGVVAGGGGTSGSTAATEAKWGSSTPAEEQSNTKTEGAPHHICRSYTDTGTYWV